MLTVSKQCQFDAAHVLTHHAGQCRNLHGHTYRVIVEVSGSDDGRDMVIDFKDLKQVIRDVIVERFDHAFIYDETSESECESGSDRQAWYEKRGVAVPLHVRKSGALFL